MSFAQDTYVTLKCGSLWAKMTKTKQNVKSATGLGEASAIIFDYTLGSAHNLQLRRCTLPGRRTGLTYSLFPFGG